MNEDETRRRTFDRELRETLTAERKLEMRRDVVIDELFNVWKERRKKGDVIKQWTPTEIIITISPVNNYLWFASQLSSHLIPWNDVAVKNWKRVGWCEARMLKEMYSSATVARAIAQQEQTCNHMCDDSYTFTHRHTPRTENKKQVLFVYLTLCESALGVSPCLFAFCL